MKVEASSRSPVNSRRKAVHASIAGLGGIAVVGFLDWITGTEVSFSIFYLLPIAWVTWRAGRKTGVILSVVGAAVWLALDMAGGKIYSLSLIHYWNALVRLGFFLIAVLLLNHIRWLNLTLEARIKERTAALEAEVAERRKIEREIAELSHHEQERIGMELHDRVGAYLAGLVFRTKSLAERLEQRLAPEAWDARSLVELVSRAVVQVRSLARLLTPVDGPAGGLVAALNRIGAEMEVLFGITCAVELPAELPALTEEQVLHLSRIAQEAARNAVQHAGAKLVEITVALRAGQLELAIRSTGRAWSGAEPSDKSLGLRLMTYRVSILGGTLAVRQELDGKTAVICTIPLAESSRPASVPGAALDPKPHEQDACIGR